MKKVYTLEAIAAASACLGALGLALGFGPFIKPGFVFDLNDPEDPMRRIVPFLLGVVSLGVLFLAWYVNRKRKTGQTVSFAH
jgi:hypothetical protein